ncbi:hypothetical protein MA612_004590 [Vibrio parahaemolyticus]|nr:hypothetical protein [Vibrio parahaemolyticus]EIV8670620.1 hypothetical protein [Vibrio parahaemolyticus]
MKPAVFWQNFELGVEIDVASTFIYDGLRNLDQMENFAYETDVFNFLYNISVGVERFLKVAIILIEFDENTDPEVHEESLITHNHADLLARLKNHRDMNLGKAHLEFISLLTRFYKSFRYDRYSLKTIHEMAKEKEALVSFLSKNITLEQVPTFGEDSIYRNTDKVKKYIGKLLSKIILQIYDIIRRAAQSKNIYTYEVRYGSKAYKLLLGKQFSFEHENVLWKELLIFMLSTQETSKHLEFIRAIDPLDFDVALLGDYLEAMGSDLKKISVTEELDHLYEELEDVSDRFEQLGLLSNMGSVLNYELDEHE